MPDPFSSAKLTFAPRDDDAERRRIHACNRVLLYAGGLDLDAESSLKLARESLRRAGPDCGLESVFRHMHDILHEQGVDPGSSDTASLKSFPPLARTSMVSRDGGCLSFVGWLAERLRSATESLPLRDAREKRC